MDTSSEAWRFQCEVRHILALMQRGKGNAARYLELVAQRRGQAAADELKREAAKEWKKTTR